MNRKAFTLVELLAVIVVLGIILLIAVPKVITTINNSKLASMNDTTRMIAAQAEREYASRLALNLLDQTNDPITCDDVTTVSANDYSGCSISFNGESAQVTITGKGNLDGLICTNGTRLDGKCSRIMDVYQESLLNGAYPRVTDGMIPVTIANNGTVTTVNPTSSSWYNYENKQWANVVLVKESGTQTRTYYQNNYGVTVNESDILSYLVWIPRYRYTLFNVAGAAAVYSGSSCTANCPQSISIVFENSSTAKSTGTTNGTQLTHPAFTYNGIELNGIWVGKFETAIGNATNAGVGNPVIKPNFVSSTTQKIASDFTNTLKLSTEAVYGLVGESRMSKNSDWGAIVYLSHSQYGVNNQIRVNNYWDASYRAKTGCGADVDDASASNTCSNQYGSGISSYPQSTTGNISGIFDLSGGSEERQMGSFTNNINLLYTSACDVDDTGFNGLYGALTFYGPCNSSITSRTDGINYPSSKYYKTYLISNWQTNTSNLGEALGETNGWYRDTATFVTAYYVWFSRGGSKLSGSTSGNFNFNYIQGVSTNGATTRIIVTIL